MWYLLKDVLSFLKDRFMFQNFFFSFFVFFDQNFFSNGRALRAILMIGTHLGKYPHLTSNPELE